MDKPQLTEKEYIAELNRVLKEQDFYEDGMEFLPYPEGATGQGVSGYSVRGPCSKIGVFARAAYQVSVLYDLKV